MVEKKKSGYWLTHLGLILGVLFIFFPVWLTFVASTVTQDAIIYPPLPMLPGTEFFENYANALFRGSPEGYGAKVPVIKMMMNSADILQLFPQQQCFMTLALIIFLEDKKAKMMI